MADSYKQRIDSGANVMTRGPESLAYQQVYGGKPAGKPGQAQSQQSPYATSTPYAAYNPNIANNPQAPRPPAFQASYGQPDGSFSSQPNFGQRDAFIQNLNQQAGMQTGGMPQFNFGQAWNQAGNMVQQGWQNPFAPQPMTPPGKPEPASPYPASWGEPPALQTRDWVPLPGGGHGSSTMANWISANMNGQAQPAQNSFAGQMAVPGGMPDPGQQVRALLSPTYGGYQDFQAQQQRASARESLATTAHHAAGGRGPTPQMSDSQLLSAILGGGQTGGRPQVSNVQDAASRSRRDQMLGQALQAGLLDESEAASLAQEFRARDAQMTYGDTLGTPRLDGRERMLQLHVADQVGYSKTLRDRLAYQDYLTSQAGMSPEEARQAAREQYAAGGDWNETARAVQTGKHASSQDWFQKEANYTKQQSAPASPPPAPKGPTATEQWNAIQRQGGGFRLTPETQRVYQAMVDEQMKSRGRGDTWAATGSPLANMARARNAKTGQGITGMEPRKR
jgi:hypothetical protein